MQALDKYTWQCYNTDIPSELGIIPTKLCKIQIFCISKERTAAMDKEKILAMSRQENEKKDPYEMKIYNKAGRNASAAMAAVVFILYVAGIFINGRQDYGIWSIMAVCSAVRYLYTGVKLKKKDHLTLGVVWSLIFAVSFTVGIAFMVKGRS